MLPYLINIGFLKVPSLPIFVVIAVVIGVFLIWKQAKEKLYSEDVLFDTILLMILGGVIFGRIGYAIFNYNEIESLLSILAFWVYPGLYLFSGIFGAIFVLWYRSNRNKEFEFWHDLDMVGFAFWVGSIIGFIGVFLSGYETGIVSSINQVPHPITLYKIIGLLVFMIPYLVFRYENDRDDWFHKTPGSVGLTTLSVFSFVIFTADFFKVRDVFYYLSPDQWISLVMLTASLSILYIRWKRTPKRDLNFILKVYRQTLTQSRKRKTTRKKRWI